MVLEQNTNKAGRLTLQRNSLSLEFRFRRTVSCKAKPKAWVGAPAYSPTTSTTGGACSR